MDFSGAPSRTPRSPESDWPTTPFRVFCPVTMAVMPAAESLTKCGTAVVSERPICAMRCRNNFRGAPYPCRLAALMVGMPPASARNSTTFLARPSAAESRAGTSRRDVIRSLVIYSNPLTTGTMVSIGATSRTCYAGEPPGGRGNDSPLIIDATGAEVSPPAFQKNVSIISRSPSTMAPSAQPRRARVATIS